MITVLTLKNQDTPLNQQSNGNLSAYKIDLLNRHLQDSVDVPERNILYHYSRLIQETPKHKLTNNSPCNHLEPRFHFSRSNKPVLYCFVHSYANEYRQQQRLWKGFLKIEKIESESQLGAYCDCLSRFLSTIVRINIYVTACKRGFYKTTTELNFFCATLCLAVLFVCPPLLGQDDVSNGVLK